MNVLLAAFAPASDEAASPSWAWIDGAATPEDAPRHVSTLMMPPTWDGCFAPLEVALRQPWDAVICVADRPTNALLVERLAINESDVAFRDSVGRRPRARVIEESGDVGYWTGLPYRDLCIRLGEAGLPAVASHNPGGHLGNYVFYRLMTWIARNRSRTLGGLIHVPNGMGLSSMPRGAEKTFLRCLLDSLDESEPASDSLLFDLARIDRPRVSQEP